MKKSWLPLPILAVLTLVLMLTVSSWTSPGTIVPLQEATPTSVTPDMPPTEESWVIIDLPEDATQLEYGAEVYRLVCKACHGDRGQGLTDDWRAQWAPKDQNCWQSKCHAQYNHPPDGFYIPPVPAVIGQPVRNFGTALNLYTYNHFFMPYHDRGSMTEKESWSVTAYILTLNGIDPGQDLNAETAAEIDLSVIDPNLGPTPTPPLQEAEAQPVPAIEETPTTVAVIGHTEESPATFPVPWIAALILAIGIVLFALLGILRRSAKSE